MMVTKKRFVQAVLVTWIPLLLACGQQTDQQELIIDVKPELLKITVTTFPEAHVGANYQNPDGTAVVITVVGGTMPYKWEITGGTLPPGILLSADTGTLFGKPTTAGTYTFTVTVTDSSKAIASRKVTGRIKPKAPKI